MTNEGITDRSIPSRVGPSLSSIIFLPVRVSDIKPNSGSIGKGTNNYRYFFRNLRLISDV